MKTMPVLTFTLFFIGCSYKPQFSKAFDYGVVYGDDNRSDTKLSEVLDRNPDLSEEEAKMLLEMEKATAGMVELDSNVKKNSDGSIVLNENLTTLNDKFNLCSGETFGDEYVLPICSGFLVGPDLLATAGHCLNRENFKTKIWIFGYDSKYSYNPKPRFDADSVYFTKEVVLWEKSYSDEKDFALVRLDRPVRKVKPLKIRTSGKPNIGETLVIIGHPSGLTSKISAGATILSTSEDNRIKTNTDSFAGNSGSAVINLKTGKVEGILVSGTDDYISSQTEDDDYCVKVNFKEENEGEEYITKITLIASGIIL